MPTDKPVACVHSSGKSLSMMSHTENVMWFRERTLKKKKRFHIVSLQERQDKSVHVLRSIIISHGVTSLGFPILSCNCEATFVTRLSFTLHKLQNRIAWLTSYEEFRNGVNQAAQWFVNCSERTRGCNGSGKYIESTLLGPILRRCHGLSCVPLFSFPLDRYMLMRGPGVRLCTVP